MIRTIASAALVAASLFAPTLATAQDAVVTAGELELTGAFTRATLPNAPVGGGYVTIANTGTEDDRLIAAASPFSPDVQIHEMRVVNDVMEMNELPDGLAIPAGETVTLQPGGLHLMFMAISEPFVEGGTVPVTLTFERAGTVEIELSVGAFGAAGADDHSGHDMHGHDTHDPDAHDHGEDHHGESGHGEH